jgi:2',3'-cyclic-nucleotide 2'-phosphodiesterase (5'-nucleotidase family)
MPTVTLLHTNDFHNHLTPDKAARLAALRSSLGESGLLLDAGDAGSSGNVTFKPGGEPILELMSDSGYDAMTVGNRDFHFSQVGFTAKLFRARFPVLCANVRPRDPSSPLPAVPSITKTLVNGFRVTVLGLTVPMITERMLVRKVSAYVFDDPIETAARLIPDLRPHCDLLVCLTHIGLGKDRELAARVPGIDLIIGGHTHALLEEGERVENTLVVQAGAHGRCFGTVQVMMEEGVQRLKANIEPL